MKNYILTAFMLVLVHLSFAQTFPTTVQPIVWLRADMPGSNPTQWQNFANNNNQIISVGQFAVVDTTCFNYQRAFEINNGSSSFIIDDFYPKANDKYTVFTVYQSDDTDNEYGLWDLHINDSDAVKLSTTKTKNIKKYIRYSQNGNTMPIINASSQSWRRIEVDSNNCYFHIARNDTFEFNGKLAEFIVFNKRLKRIDNEKVHTYLAIKYGIGVYYLNYVNSQDSILWNYRKNKDYQYDVVGLGRDDGLGLYQKQTAANGGHSKLIMYKNNIEYLNMYNSSYIDNQNLILYGHNGDSINEFIGNSGDPFELNTLKRRWRIRPFGNAIRQESFDIKFHFDDIDEDNYLYLAVNRDGNEDFNIGNTTLIKPSNIDVVNKILTYNNIEWDIDNSGTDVFSFVRSDEYVQQIKTNNNDNNTTSSFVNITNQNDINILPRLNTKQNDTTQIQFISYELFPNPSEGEFSLSISSNNTQTIEMRVYDVNGKEVLYDHYSGKKEYLIKKSINVIGTYLINLRTESESKNIKLIIK